MLQLVAALLAVATVAADPPTYASLLGNSQFANISEIEQFILSLAELNRLQNEIDGEPDLAADSTGQSYLEAVGRQKPRRSDEIPYLFEGDIILTEEQMNETLQAKRTEALYAKLGRSPPTKRSLKSKLKFRWELPVAYWIDTNTGVDPDLIQAGVDMWAALTCVTFEKFRKRPHGRPNIRFIRGEEGLWSQMTLMFWLFRSGCYSYKGRHPKNEMQEIGIRGDCEIVGSVAHEIAHALGFFHEQSRPERDEYVKIHKRNIDSKYKKNFNRRDASETIDYGVEYDYGSVMHYVGDAFPKYDGDLTITTRDDKYQSTIGQREAPSFADVKQMNIAYCSDVCRGSNLACKDGGYPDPKNCTVCRCPPGLGGTLCDKVRHSPATCGDTDLTADLRSKEITISGDTDCYYRIRAPAGRRVYVFFPIVDFRNEQPPCVGSYVEVKYKANAVVSGARFCSSLKPSSVTSEGEQLLLIYKGASRSKLTFRYKYFPSTPVDTTTAAPVKTTTTTTATPKPPTTTSTTLKPTTPKPTKTSTAAPTTTTAATTTTTEPCTPPKPKPTTTMSPKPRPTTTMTPKPEHTTTATPLHCRWSECSGECGGCGTQTRRCLGKRQKRYCATTPCPGDVCCEPFTFISNGVCSRGTMVKMTKYPMEDTIRWYTSANSNTIPEDEPTTTLSSTDKRTVDIQPPNLPLNIELPDTIDVSKTTSLRASRISASNPNELEGSGI